MTRAFPRLALSVGLASALAAGPAHAAEWQQLSATAAGLFGGGASAVIDDGSVVFGYADVVEGGGSADHTPVRWIRQPDGTFVADALGEGATVLDLPRGTAIDASSDGTAAALYALPKWTETGGIACGPFCPPENENAAITADGTRIAANTFVNSPDVRVILWSDTEVDVIDAVAGSLFGQLHVWDVSADGNVAVGEYPGPNGVQPVVWTRNGPQDWSRALPGLPPGANVARAFRVSDDGQHALVQWSPTDYGNLGFGVILWNAATGYEDINADGCRPDVINGDGSAAVGRCDLFLGRWSRGIGWEIFTNIPYFVARDVTPDGRYAVGGGCGGTCARFADLGPVPNGECVNGIDDDGDGRIDFGVGPTFDPGCASASDLSERDPTLPCDDGADNDGDGYTDFPSDPACKNVTWNRENAKCQDGINNDGDGLIDFDGGASFNGGVPLTAIDRQCRNRPWRNNEAPDSCGLGFEAGIAALLLRRRMARIARGRRS